MQILKTSSNVSLTRRWRTSKFIGQNDYLSMIWSSIPANNSRQLSAAVQRLERKKVGLKGIEGLRGGYWALVDMRDILVNVFCRKKGESLDKLWKDLPQIDRNLLKCSFPDKLIPVKDAVFHYKNKERLPFYILHREGRKKKEEAGAGRNQAGAFVFG